jgi:hypothetical protein
MDFNMKAYEFIVVDCWALDGSRILKRFTTISHALKSMHISRFSDIKDCTTGAKDNAYGFQWRFANRGVEYVGDELTMDQLLALRNPPLGADDIENLQLKEPIHIGGRAAVAIDCWNIDESRLLRRFPSIAEIRDALQIKSTGDVRDCCLGNKGNRRVYT